MASSTAAAPVAASATGTCSRFRFGRFCLPRACSSFSALLSANDTPTAPAAAQASALSAWSRRCKCSRLMTLLLLPWPLPSPAPHQRLPLPLLPSSFDWERGVVPSRDCCGGCLGTARPKRKWKGERLLLVVDEAEGERGREDGEGRAAAAASVELLRISLMP